MHLLLTRPEEDAGPLAAELEALGHTVTMAPMMRIEFFTDAHYDLNGVQAILLTSANGARALARATAMRDLPVLAVGGATAAAARAAGFKAVMSADGDVNALAALVRQQCRPDDGDLLHVSGHDLAGDLAGLLAADGFTVRRAVLYRAAAADRLDPAAAQALAAGTLDGVVLFSPRTATILCRLLRAEKFDGVCRTLDVYALSKAVAAAVSPLPWRGCHVAARPTQAGLVDLLRQGAGMSDRDDKRTDAPWGQPENGGPASVDGVPGDGGEPLAAEAVEPDDTPEEPAIEVDAREADDDAAGTIDAEPVDDPRDAEPDDDESFDIEGPAPRRRSRVGAVLVVLLVVIVAGGGAAYYFWPQLSARFGLPTFGLDRVASDRAAERQRLDLLETASRDQARELQRLSDDVKRLLAAGSAPGSGASNGIAVNDLAARVSALEDVVQAMSDNGTKLPADARADIAELAARVMALTKAHNAAPADEVPAEVEQRLSALAARVDAVGGAETDLAAARGQIAELTQRNRQLAAEVGTLSDRMAALESKAAAPGGDRNDALVLAVGQLREAIAAGRPFAAALDSVAALAGDEAAIAAPIGTLRGSAARGVVTLDELRRRFPDMAAAVMRAGDKADAGIVDRTWNRLSGLVVVRRTGEVAGNAPDAVLARAEQRLGAGNLAAANDELEALSGPRAAAAATWRAAAQDRIAADAAVATLYTHAINAVAGG